MIDEAMQSRGSSTTRKDNEEGATYQKEIDDDGKKQRERKRGRE